MQHRLENMRRGNLSRPAGSKARIDAANLRWARAMAWCPLEYRADYFRFRVSKRMLAADARALVEELIATDLARYAKTGQLQQAKRLRTREAT